VGRTRELVDMRTDLRWLADVQGALLRHEDGDLNREINQSIQRFREWTTDEGFPLYLQPYTTALTGGPTAPFSWLELDLSAITPALAHVNSVEVTINGRRCQLDQVPWEQRNDYQGWSGPANGYPVAWVRYGFKLGILPPPMGSIAATVWYLPVFADLVNDSDTFEGYSGWEEWLRWDCFCTLLTRDQYPQLIANAQGERDRLRGEITARLRKDRPSVVRRRDVAGRRGTRFPWGVW
jgi:hypothetical protein